MTTTMKTSTHPAYLINPTHATHTLVAPSFFQYDGVTITFTPRLGEDAGDFGYDYVKVFVSDDNDKVFVSTIEQVLVWNNTDTRTWKLEKGLRVWSADDARKIWNACISRGWKVQP